MFICPHFIATKNKETESAFVLPALSFVNRLLIMWKTYRMSKTLWPCTSCYHLNFFFLGSNFFRQQSNQTCSCLTSYLLCWRSPSSGFMNSSSSCTFLCGDGVLWVISSSFLSANKGNNLKLKFDVGRPFSPLCLFFDSPSSLPPSQCLPLGGWFRLD